MHKKPTVTGFPPVEIDRAEVRQSWAAIAQPKAGRRIRKKPREVLWFKAAGLYSELGAVRMPGDS